jgi:type II secretory pathway pseudopilin PulG
MGDHVTQQIVFQNKAGLTLVEVMIALVVSLLVFLALMQTTLMSIDSGVRNDLRDEAVRVAEARMNEMRSQAFDSVNPDAGAISGCDCPSGFPSSGVCETRNIRNIQQSFCTNLSSQLLDPEVKQVTVIVGWKWKDNPYYHRISTIRKSS